MIPEPSAEQAAFLDAVQTDHVLGDCVAGSGKTTTVLLIAKRFPQAKILQVTYNAQLKAEVRAKAREAGLTNLEIHTFHSLARAYYISTGYDDTMIKRVIEHRIAPRRSLPRVDIFVLDETQDIVLTYYCLLRKFVGDLGKQPRMVVLGDRYQGIYGFKGADIRFLTLAPQIWNWHEFAPLTLSTSYRVTRPIAAFVNECMLGYERLQSVRDGVPVEYVICNQFCVHGWLADELVALMAEGEYTPEDIFILAGSIKGSSSPVRLLENALIERGIPCYFPTSDERVPDEDLLENKVVFSTFHQSKGRERAIVVVYGFDATYFSFYGKDYDPAVCPETLYVAATRAKDRLYLLQSESKGRLPFLRLPTASNTFVRIRRGCDPTTDGTATAIVPKEGALSFVGEQHTETVTGIIRFLKESALYHLTALVSDLFEEEVEETYRVDIPSKVVSSVGSEDVSDLNGIVIPAMYEARFCVGDGGMSTIETDVRNRYMDLVKNGSHPFLRQACAQLPPRLVGVADFLQIAVVYTSVLEQVYNRIHQIERYDWLTENDVTACFGVLKPHLSEATIFEQPVEIQTRLFSEFGLVTLVGRLDAVNTDCVWEIKCVDTVTIEHFLQVILYAWIWKHAYVLDHGPREFRLLNIRTGQQFRLNAASHNLEEAVYIVFQNKWGKKPALSDEEFLAACRNYR